MLCLPPLYPARGTCTSYCNRARSLEAVPHNSPTTSHTRILVGVCSLSRDKTEATREHKAYFAEQESQSAKKFQFPLGGDVREGQSHTRSGTVECVCLPSNLCNSPALVYCNNRSQVLAIQQATLTARPGGNTVTLPLSRWASGHGDWEPREQVGAERVQVTGVWTPRV